MMKIDVMFVLWGQRLQGVDSDMLSAIAKHIIADNCCGARFGKPQGGSYLGLVQKKKQIKAYNEPYRMDKASKKDGFPTTKREIAATC
jgi:hypothetical protein